MVTFIISSTEFIIFLLFQASCFLIILLFRTLALGRDFLLFFTSLVLLSILVNRSTLINEKLHIVGIQKVSDFYNDISIQNEITVMDTSCLVGINIMG